MVESAQGGCTEAPVVTAQYRAVHTQTSVTRRAQRRRGRQAQASALERHPAPGEKGQQEQLIFVFESSGM